MRWFSETLYKDFRQSLLVDEILYEGQTSYQDVLIFKNPRFGRVLVLDGIIQTTEGDEFCYHEMMAHVPLFSHGEAKKVLIIGGGDGGILREVLKHPRTKPTVIELDETVVNICKKFLPSLSKGSFDDTRAEIHYMDGVSFVKDTSEQFDIIIVDSTDPIGPGAALFSENFYADCARCLSPRGIMVTQSGVAYMQKEEVKETYQRMKKFFIDPSLYISQVPAYGAGFMTFGWGSHSALPRNTSFSKLEERWKSLGLKLKYYSPSSHIASFALPGYIENLKT
ncbi:MAG: spermidine synthase [Rhodospirillaceae bacterium]|nr:spermidine synthase [Rhodospirillaceae bacterium]